MFETVDMFHETAIPYAIKPSVKALPTLAAAPSIQTHVASIAFAYSAASSFAPAALGFRLNPSESV
jgi:hypothetical protein